MRLDKYICKSTELTRNEAKQLLKMGRVKVDGETVKSGALHVQETSEVTIEDRPINVRETRYIMMHKPVDTICSNVDELYPSILHYIDVDRAFDLHIAGRLDADTTGLVLITDDGKWSHNIISPKKSCKKRYRVWLADDLDENVETLFETGISLHNERELTLPATLERVNTKEVLLTITEGKYHQVKRMFAAVGNKVVGLHREKIGDVTLDASLPLGHWRYLTPEEVASFN